MLLNASTCSCVCVYKRVFVVMYVVTQEILVTTKVQYVLTSSSNIDMGPIRINIFFLELFLSYRFGIR